MEYEIVALYVVGYFVTAVMLDLLLYSERETPLPERLVVLGMIYLIALAWPVLWLMGVAHKLAKKLRKRLGL